MSSPLPRSSCGVRVRRFASQERIARARAPPPLSRARLTVESAARGREDGGREGGRRAFLATELHDILLTKLFEVKSQIEEVSSSQSCIHEDTFTVCWLAD